MSNKSAFVGGFVGGALGSLAVNAPRGTLGKIWTILCLILLPLWAAFLGYAIVRPIDAGLGIAPLLTAFLMVGPVVIFTGIAAIKVTSRIGLFRAYGIWWKTFASSSVLGKSLLSSPGILLFVAGIGAALGNQVVGVLGASASAVAVIVVGVYVGKQQNNYLAYAESVISRVTSVLGAELVDGSIRWTSDFSTISVSPFPVEAMVNLTALSDLHHRCAQFAPEYELIDLSATGVTFVPVTSDTRERRTSILQ